MRIIIAGTTNFGMLERLAGRIDAGYQVVHDKDTEIRPGCRFFLVLGADTLRAVAPVLDAAATAVVVSDPIRMGCLDAFSRAEEDIDQDLREGVYWFDFYYSAKCCNFMHFHVPFEAALEFLQQVMADEGEAVVPLDNDAFVEHLLERAGARVSFIEALTGFSYQPKKTDADRKEYRRRFLLWLTRRSSFKELEKLLTDYSGKTADAVGIQRILDNFREHGDTVRQAVGEVLKNAKAGVADNRRIAEAHEMSVFELNYFENACRNAGILG